MSLRTRLAYLAGGLALLLGLFALVNPRWTADLIGLQITQPHGLSEIRATYGAIFSTMGGAMLWAVPRRPRAALWLRLPAALWLAAAAGRLASIIIDGTLTAPNIGSLALELLVGGAAMWGSFETPLKPVRVTPAEQENSGP